MKQLQRVSFNQYKRAVNVRGSNQYKKRKKNSTRAMVCASLILLVSFFAILHYSVIGIRIGTRVTKAWATANLKIQEAYAPTKNIVYAEEKIASASATPTPIFKDIRVEKVYNFLSNKNSPLSNYAELIVKEADKNDISWTLVVAIAGKESSFGTAIKPNSYNAWGVMQWDARGNRSIRSFSSWEEGIKFESEMLSKNFRKDSNAGIQARYCPASDNCSPTWTNDVTNFQASINQ